MPAAISWTNNALATVAAYPAVSSAQMTSIAFDAAYPAANLRDPDPSRVARVNYVRNGTAGGFAMPQIRWADTAGACGRTRVLALLNVRLPSDATDVSLAVYTHAGGSAGGSFASAATYTAAERVPIPGTTDRFNLYWLRTARQNNIGWMDFRIDLPPSTSGYIEIGHAWAGDALVLDAFEEHWGQQPVDGSEVERTAGGALVASVLPVRQTLRIGMSALTKDQAFGSSAAPTLPSLRTLQFEAGRSAPVIALPRTDSAFNLQTLGVYGALRNPPSLRHLGGDYYGSEFDVEQIR